MEHCKTNKISSIQQIIELLQQGFTDWNTLGHVNVKTVDNLSLFSYTHQAMVKRDWNFFECVSRGLIINNVTGEIVARPFDKFFNWGEDGRTSDSSIQSITTKYDGSLGILYRTGNGFKIATRGSFDGEQAVWATEFLNDNYNLIGMPTELTLLFEIIYPSNRIVVNYGDKERLVLIGARDRFTGELLTVRETSKIAKEFNFHSSVWWGFEDVKEIKEKVLELSGNEEGFVVVFDDGQMFKFKGLEYLKLHRLVSGMSFKNVLNMFADGHIKEFLEETPDHFQCEVKSKIGFIEIVVERIARATEVAFASAPTGNRKEFALWVFAEHKRLAPYLFAMLDGRDIEPLILKTYDWSKYE